MWGGQGCCFAINRRYAVNFVHPPGLEGRGNGDTLFVTCLDPTLDEISFMHIYVHHPLKK